MLGGGQAASRTAASIRRGSPSTGRPPVRRQTIQVIGLDRGRDDTPCRPCDGEELIGKTLGLRADEIGGPTALDYRFPAKP